ncbi:IS66 family insertion sequence element accessory protein TnpA [Coprococcus phoceensis]|uniref:IS66 family insertion sequence element accessory protein TnpA n=1 Tax=Coprococcus phoceensis TaxID=1870993 RepID=UPI0008D8E7C3|nr:transposase [Coprococcus phoceensis]
MKAKRVNREEQLKLIMECRSSGLSDYQWCEAHGIHPGTFYNWVSKLRKADVTLPDSESKHLGTPVHQEVVKVDLVSNPVPSTTIMKQNTRILAMPSTDASVAMEIVMDNSTIT